MKYLTILSLLIVGLYEAPGTQAAAECNDCKEFFKEIMISPLTECTDAVIPWDVFPCFPIMAPTPDYNGLTSFLNAVAVCVGSDVVITEECLKQKENPIEAFIRTINEGINPAVRNWLSGLKKDDPYKGWLIVDPDTTSQDDYLTAVTNQCEKLDPASDGGYRAAVLEHRTPVTVDDDWNKTLKKKFDKWFGDCAKVSSGAPGDPGASESLGGAPDLDVPAMGAAAPSAP